MKILKILFYPIHFIKRSCDKLYTNLYIKNALSSCGKHVRISQNFIGTYFNIEVGSNTAIGPNCVFYCSLAKISIGNHVMISPNVTIITGSHKTDCIGRYMIDIKETEKIEDGVEKYDKPVIIEDDVWIGANVLILKGVTIGKGSIIQAGSIVTRSVKPYTIFTNNNLAIKRFSDEEIRQHESILGEQ